MKKFFILLFCISFSAISFSSEMVKGLGLTKCTTFNSATNDEKVIYMSWLAGFMSSHNILKKKMHAKNITYNRSQLWIESFCYNNPNQTFKNAATSFIKEFPK
tara:strand:+ start:313 stop:621 length:309 start_codon:yes stop_codon:yes gene_type:complete